MDVVIAEPPSPDEPTVTLDCYDFPASFKTHHLHDIFREYENMRGGYRIKWLEDTRALIVFEHPAAGELCYFVFNYSVGRAINHVKC